jgi:hypothetical protein
MNPWQYTKDFAFIDKFVVTHNYPFLKYCYLEIFCNGSITSCLISNMKKRVLLNCSSSPSVPLAHYIFSGWYKNKRLNAVFNFAIIGLAILFLCAPQTWAIPQQHYFSRSLIALVLFGGACLFFLKKSKSQKTSSSWQVPLGLFICLNSLIIFHGYHFSTFIEAFKSEISKQTGDIPFERTSIDKKQAFLYGWAWTYPVMSKVLNESHNNAVIKIPEFYRGWVPKL